jgi:RimJ/RimL family protein N-acetyltransferase
VATTTLATPRLILRELDARDLDAWVEGDAEVLRERTGARFQRPVEAPPLFADDLPTLRDLLGQAGGDARHQVWLLIEKDSGEPVGVAGFSTDQHVATTGYSVLPRFEGRGYTTEALQELLDHVRTQVGVDLVRATIPPDNRASIRVAEKLGMVNTGTDVDPEVGEVLVYEARRSV